MNKQRNSLLFMILPVVLFLAVAQADTSPEANIRVSNQINSLGNLPQGLAPAVAKALQDDLPAAYQLSKAPPNFRADNPSQSMRFTFTPEGVQVQSADGSWEWHMKLTRWGCGGKMEAVPEADLVAKGGRLSYQRGPDLTEWYINTTWGLEQGFTLGRRPSASNAKTSHVVLQLALSGTLRPQLHDNDLLKASGQALLLYGAEGQAAVRYSGLYAHDADGKSLPAHMALVGDSLCILVDDSSARYPITIDPWVQQAKLTASDGVADDRFGCSVAIDGDTVVVGACLDNSGTGSAYVFEKPGGGWATTSTYKAKLTAIDGANGDSFGGSVAIDGDTIVVGANCDDSWTGSAYVFVKDFSGWATTSTYNAKLTANDGAAYDLFGCSVAIDGDTVVVGAYLDNSGTGSAYVFEKPGGGWADMTHTAKLTASGAEEGGSFGGSVAIDGNTVVVGASYDNSSKGSAYVFVNHLSGWPTTGMYDAKLTDSDGATYDQFGFSVAIDGNTVVVGAPGKDNYKGLAYIFVEPVSGWSTTINCNAKLTASDGAASDYFGNSVAVNGDRAVVGACEDNSDTGSAYIFEKSGWAWLGLLEETIKLTASDSEASDYFGISVAVNGDTAVVGARGDNDSTGSAYVFVLDTTPPGVPIVTGDTPNKDTSPTWTWSSGGGGGSGLFRHRLDNPDLSSQPETTDISFTPSSVLSEGEGIDHTLYVQERDAAENWSNSGSFNIEIDSAKPCSEASSPSAVDDLHATFDVTYTWDDVYDDGTICGAASSGSGVAQVDLYVMAPGESSYTLIDTDSDGSIDGVFQYTVTTEGVYSFKTIATDRAGNEEYKTPGSYDTETVYASEFAGYAILAVGEIAGDPAGLISHTLTANNVYQHLVNRKFTLVADPGDPLDFIKYFNPYATVQTGEDDYSEGETISYRTAMQNAVQQWALAKMTVLPGPLYIILENHGSTDRFYLDPPAYLEAYELDGWLDNLEANLAAEGIYEDIVIVLGTCYSASFINDLSESGKNRIIVASTAVDEPSYRGPMEPGGVRDGEFFISALFDAWARDDALGNGIDLRAAFQSAVQSTEIHTDSGVSNSPAPYFDTAMQHPHLDDDADGQGSNTLTPGGDGDVAQTIYLGFGTAAPDPVVVTEVGKDPDTPITGHSATLWATVSDKALTSRVWVEVREPGMTLGGGVDQQIVNLIEVELTWNATESRYELDYNDFWTEGRYTLFFYARDNTGIISPFKKTYLYKSKTPNDPPGAFNLLAPANGSTTTTTAGLGAGWEVSVDPDWDDVTYTLEIRDDNTDPMWSGVTFYFKQEGITRNMCVVQDEAGFIDERSYLWKVTAIDEYGADTVSNQEWGFEIDDNNPGNGWLDIMVYDSTTDCPIEHAVVSGSGLLSIDAFGSGYFLGFAPAGNNYSVTVSATGYETEIFTGVSVVEYETIPRVFGLDPAQANPSSGLPAILLLLLGN